MDASKLLSSASIVPVVVIDDADKAIPLAECLYKAGLSIIEVTLRTPAALESIHRITTSVPEMIVGAGSVQHQRQINSLQQAGVQFIVSPGGTDDLIEAAVAAKMPFVPGAATPTEMIKLYQHGYILQKFFPAELAGGQAYLEAVSGPLPEIRFMPTGGITPELALTYLKLNNVSCIGGSWITPAELLKVGNFEAISKLAVAASTINR